MLLNHHRLTFALAASETERGFERAGLGIDATARKAIDDAKAVTMLDVPTVIPTRLADLKTAIRKLESGLRSRTS